MQAVQEVKSKLIGEDMMIQLQNHIENMMKLVMKKSWTNIKDYLKL